MKSPDLEADEGLLIIRSVGSGHLASLNGRRERRAVWVRGGGGGGGDVTWNGRWTLKWTVKWK